MFLKIKKVAVSMMVVILIFFIFTKPVKANIFTAEEDFRGKSETEEGIEETIENDNGGLFEKIIAKMIRWYCGNCI